MIEGAPSAGLGPNALTPEQKAKLIYNEAHSELSGRLWRAALGSADSSDDGVPAKARAAMTSGQGGALGLDRLLALLDSRAHGASPAADAPAAVAAPGKAEAAPAGVAAAPLAMEDGPNARYAGMLDAAAARTGVPASALAAIVDAEAAKGAGGTWQPYSRNPRSSAAGLGQFLNRSWEGEAERSGTWLNATAQANGWLNARGQVKSENRGALLAMRYDPRASIETVADYARANLQALRGSGVHIGEGAEHVAQAAYLGHHLGLGDARQFLAGGLSPDRARKLLGAQVGTAAAERRIAQTGSAVSAHRSWLLDYVGKHVRPDRFG